MLSPAAKQNGAQSLEGMKVLILVQGELAQSPRMLNHARALCNAGSSVSLVGWTQLPLPEDITRAPRLSVHRISEAGAERLDAVPRTFYVPTAASRAARATMRLGWLLAAKSGGFGGASVANPPSPPAVRLCPFSAP